MKQDWENIYVTMRPELLKYTYRLCYNMAFAEDIVQDVFLESLVKWDIIYEHENIRGWLYETCKYKTLSWYTKYKKIKEHECLLNEEIVTVVFNKDESLEDILLYETLHRCLNEKEYKLFILKIQYYMTFKEIADCLNDSEAACKMRYWRILKRLRFIGEKNEKY